MKYIIVILFAATFLGSCKKDDHHLVAPPAALNIINAISGSSSLIADINNKLLYYQGQPGVAYGSSLLYTPVSGNISIVLRYQSDTATTIFNQNVNLPSNTIHSLFLTGSVGSVESLWVTDTLPYHGPQGHGTADSVVGIRFVNLSTGSAPITINILGNPANFETQNLSYKSITRFKNYAATADIDSYTFEFRDQVSGDLLASYTLTEINGNGYTNNVLFKNMTIALIGPVGYQTAILIRNY